MKTKYLLILLFAILFYNCSNERIQLLNQAEDVLPGNWEIESIKLPMHSMGITYQGNMFIADTILFNVGIIEISEFSADTLDTQHSNSGKVNCILRISDESFPYGISSLFISGEDIFSSFEYNGPPGVDTIDTPGEEFIWSSQVFNNNYFISILNHNNIELGKANDRDNHVIKLRRL